MATENLDSMLYNTSPSKSEIISLSFSKSLNADYLMLSDETATSKKFLSILKWFKNFNEIEHKSNNFKKNKINKPEDIFQSLSKIDEKSSRIVIFTRKGYVIEKILNINPGFKLFVFTDSQKVHDLSLLRYNVSVVKTAKFKRIMDDFIYKQMDKYKKDIFYGNNNIFPTPENAPMSHQTSLYGSSKLYCEGLITSFDFCIDSTLLKLSDITNLITEQKAKN